ncbi:hypothetical protein HRE39_11645 [Enterococcus faecalis]|nr:hypothetical protein [Enterococcus faecalis]
MLAIIFLFILALIFILLGGLISSERFFHVLPKSIQKHEYQYAKVCVELAIFVGFIIFASIILLEIFQINLMEYYVKLPFYGIYPVIYCIFRFLKAKEESNIVNTVISIADKRHDRLDYHYFDYLLIDAENLLIKMERKLNTLKAFSLTPVILLLVNNLPNVLKAFTQSKNRSLQDYSNIVLVLIATFYFYETYQCYKNCQNQSYIIKVIKQQRVLAKYPNALKKNTAPHF